MASALPSDHMAAQGAQDHDGRNAYTPHVQVKEQQDVVVVEEEVRVGKPHRCNDRLEDFVQALFEGDLRRTVPGPAKLFWQCYNSKPGEEPTDPFFYLELDDKGKLVPKSQR